MKRGVRYGLIAFAVLAALLVTVVGAVLIWSSYRQREAERAWAGSFDSLDSLLKRYPQTGNNAAAIKLATIVRPIGLSFVEVASEPEATAQARERFDEINQFLATLEKKRDDGTSVPVPQPVVAALSAMKPALDAAEAHINSSEAIVWTSDLTKGLVAPTPPLLALRYLGTAFLARGFQAAQAGRIQAAAASLRACDRVMLSLEERPELITQLIVMALSLHRNSVLMQIGGESIPGMTDPEKRTDRIVPLLRSIAAEAVLLPVTAQGNQAAVGSHPLGRTANTVFSGIWMGDTSWRLHQLVSDLRSEDPCRADMAGLQRRVEANTPWWNPAYGFETPGLIRSWATAAAATLDNELTSLVVAAHAKSGRAPGERVMETHASHTCQSLTWSVETLPEGDVLIGTRSGQPVDRIILTRSSFHVVRRDVRR